MYRSGLFAFGLVWFNGISTIVGLFNAESGSYIYIKYDLYTHFADNVPKWAWAYFLHTLKWLQVFLSNTNNSIYY